MTTRSLFLILAVVAATACGPGSDLDGAHAPHGGAAVESWAVTAWGERFELFPEVEPLVAGETAMAHVHVTLLDGFQPARDGSVTVIFADAAGREERFVSSGLARPGIFNVAIQPQAPGERTLRFAVESGGAAETLAGGKVRIGAPGEPGGGLLLPPHPPASGDGGEPVEFLKEQQWRTPFATAWAEHGALHPSLTGFARVEAPAGGEVVITAPVDGVVHASAWPHTGRAVARGETLISIIPAAPSESSLATLEAAVRELEALSGATEARRQRLESLLTLEATSRREVELVRAEATGLEARLVAAREDLAAAEAGRRGRGGVAGLTVTAPFAGRVAEVTVSPGERVAAGAPLLRLLRERPVWLRVALEPRAAGQLDGGLAGLVLDSGADAAPLEVPAGLVRLVAVAPEVDALSGTVDALLEVDQTVDFLRPGLRATAQLLLRGRIEGIILPDTAVVDDAGTPVIYVQVEGEQFARREVEVRHREGDRVLVEGVLPGERIVTRGGAAIRRAALLASGSVEGHVH